MVEQLPRFVQDVLLALKDAKQPVSRVDLLTQHNGYFSKYFGAWTKKGRGKWKKRYSYLLRATSTTHGSLEFVLSDDGKEAVNRIE